MKEILEEINNLSNMFNSLFEVEGLGDPASEVPPSTNKIKQTRKTKDGKVEVVSVEDELFPYDGNKREQFRQKIIDKINDMIQGTATLEDLLQLVRQKQVKPVKEGFEGAIELLEEIINEVSLSKWKEAAKKAYDSRKEVADKSAEADKDSWEKYEKAVAKSPENEPELFKRTVDTGAVAYKDKKRAEHAMGVYANTPDSKHSANKYNRAIKKSLQGRDDKYVKTGKRSDLNRAIDAFHLAKLDPVKNRADESFEGAIEILEAIINEVSSTTMRNALHAHNERKRELEDRANKRIGEIFKKNGIKGNTYGATTPEDRERAIRTEKEIQNDSEMKNIQKEQEKRARKNKLYVDALNKIHRAKLAEAQELLEAIINEVSDATVERAVTHVNNKLMNSLFTGGGTNQKDIDKYKSIKKLADLRAKRAGKKLIADVDAGLYKHVKEAQELLEEIISEVSNERRKEAAKNSIKGREEKAHQAYQEYSDATRNFDPHFYANATMAQKERIERTGDKAADAQDRANYARRVAEEPVKEARDLEDTVIKAHKEGKISAEKMGELVKKAHEIPSDASYFHKSKGEKGEWKTKRRHMDYARNTLADDWGKDDDKKIEASIKRKAKKDKSFPLFQTLKAYKDRKEPLKEAVELIEKFTEEQRTEAAKNSIQKREEEYEKASKELNNVTGKLNPITMVDGKLNTKQHDKVANAIDKANRAESRVSHAKKIISRTLAKKEPKLNMKFTNVLGESDVLEGLLVNDGRGDLLDDISKVITGKTLKQHAQNAIKKSIKGIAKVDKDKKS